MVQTLEQATKTESKRIKIPAKIRPFDVGYRVVNKHGQALALRPINPDNARDLRITAAAGT